MFALIVEKGKKLMFRLLILMFFTVSLAAMDHPVSITLSKKARSGYIMSVSVPKGFGIQADAPNKIKLSSSNGLQIATPELKFTGNTMIDKPEYYEKVNDMQVKLTGKGVLDITAKIFYCDFTKNVCLPATIKKEETIK